MTKVSVSQTTSRTASDVNVTLVMGEYHAVSVKSLATSVGVSFLWYFSHSKFVAKGLRSYFMANKNFVCRVRTFNNNSLQKNLLINPKIAQASVQIPMRPRIRKVGLKRIFNSQINL